MKSGTFLLLGVSLFFFCACGKDSVNTKEPLKLEKISSMYLDYGSIPDSSLKINYNIEYSGNLVSRIFHGKDSNRDKRVLLERWKTDYKNENQCDIRYVYKNDTVFMKRMQKEATSDLIGWSILNKKGKILKQVASFDDTTVYTYNAKGLLTESIRRNSINYLKKRYYFNSRNNLEKIITYKCSFDGKWSPLYEQRFGNYDDAPNPFKFLAVVEGAFLRSLSENNFRTYEYTQFDPKGNIESEKYITPLKYDAAGNPLFL